MISTTVFFAVTGCILGCVGGKQTALVVAQCKETEMALNWTSLLYGTY